MSINDELEAIETLFQVQLPIDYRAFLTTHHEDLLDPSLSCEMTAIAGVGDIATIDGLYTAKQILDNERRQASCDPEQRMLIIGYELFGGYLYLNYSSERLGEIYFRAPYVSNQFGYLANTFSSFLAKCSPTDS